MLALLAQSLIRSPLTSLLLITAEKDVCSPPAAAAPAAPTPGEYPCNRSAACAVMYAIRTNVMVSPRLTIELLVETGKFACARHHVARTHMAGFRCAIGI